MSISAVCVMIEIGSVSQCVKHVDYIVLDPTIRWLLGACLWWVSMCFADLLYTKLTGPARPLKSPNGVVGHTIGD